MYTLGIDIGSSSSKAVLLKTQRNHCRRCHSGRYLLQRTFKSPLQQIMQQSGLELNEIDCYQALIMDAFCGLANEQISEITRHAKGIAWLLPGTEPLSISAVRMLRLSARILTAILS